MFFNPFLFEDFGLYSIVFILQIIFIIHAAKTSRREWIWLLIFLPALGTVIYLVSEILPGFSFSETGDQLQRFLFPGVKINELKKRLTLANTDANRLLLADEYAKQRKYTEAIALTQACLAGIYANDTDLLLRMARLHALNGDYTISLHFFNRFLPLHHNRFNRPEDEIMYARTLAGVGETDKAETEFKRIIRVHHSIEGLYFYGVMLQQLGRTAEARTQFATVQTEKKLHPKYVRRKNHEWISLSRRALKHV